MIQRASNHQFHRNFVCDACGEDIDHARDVVLVRETYALPEEPDCYHMHHQCAERFVERQPGRWSIFPLASMEAVWLLPMIPSLIHEQEESVATDHAVLA